MNDSTREPPLSPELAAQLRLHERQRRLELERRREGSAQQGLIRTPGQKRGFKPLPTKLSHRTPEFESQNPPTLRRARLDANHPSSPSTPPQFRAEQAKTDLGKPPTALQGQQQSDSDDIETLTERVPDTSAPASPPGPTVKRRLLRFGLLIIVPLLVVLAGIWFYIHGGRYVTTENAYVKANIVAISADIKGRVTQVLVGDNQYVEAGTLLFSLDTVPYEINIAQAEADMAVVRADIEALRADYREALVSIEEAKEEKSHQEKELLRQENMQNRGIGTTKELDLARHNAVMAKRRLNTQQARARQALASLNGKERIKAEQHPRYLRALASKKHAENTMEKTQIFAPASGIVSNMKLQAGEYVDDGKPVFSLIETQPLWIEANLKETQLTHLVEGQNTTFVADAYPDVTWTATVKTIAPATGAEFSLLPPQNATGNWVKVVQRIPVRLEIGNPTTTQEDKPIRPLRAGMTVTVSIDTRHERELPVIVAQIIAATPMPAFVRQWLTSSS